MHKEVFFFLKSLFLIASNPGHGNPEYLFHFISNWIYALSCFPGGTVGGIQPPVQETQETWVWSLGREDTVEQEVATHSSVLAWKIPWTEDLVGYKPRGRNDWDMSARTHTRTFLWRCSTLRCQEIQTANKLVRIRPPLICFLIY